MAANTKGKKVVRTRRRERKNIEKGQVHISSSFNNTMVTITDPNGNAIFLGQRWWLRLPRKQEIHPLRRADCC